MIRPAKRIGCKHIACKPAKCPCTQRVKHGKLCLPIRRVAHNTAIRCQAVIQSRHLRYIDLRQPPRRFTARHAHDFTLFHLKKRHITEWPVKIKQPRLGRNERGCHSALFAVNRKRGFEQPRHMALAAMRRIGARAVNIGDFPFFAAGAQPIRQHLHHRAQRALFFAQQHRAAVKEMHKKIVVKAALIRETGFPKLPDARHILRLCPPDHACGSFGTAVYFTPRMTG